MKNFRPVDHQKHTELKTKLDNSRFIKMVFTMVVDCGCDTF